MDIENGEVYDLADYPEDLPFEQEYVPQFAFGQARVGDVLRQGIDQSVPDGWHELDGSSQRAVEWPEFKRAMKMVAPRFILPQAERVIAGHRYIIKLGQHVREE